jgi:hypothetical protein
MDEWIPFFLLPNLKVRGAIECDGIAAVVPPYDERVTEVCSAHPNFKEFLSRFQNTFRQQIWPSVLMLSAKAPNSYRTVDAVASFRDLVSLSVIPRARALVLKYQRQHQITYSDTFSLYPWTLDKNYEYLTSHTPSGMSMHVVEEFGGQSSPEISMMSLQTGELDKPLMLALFKRWRIRYSGRSVTWKDRALFRSLNMANQASQAPGGPDTTYYDVGRSIALWISVFEILAHPPNANANLQVVCDLLEKVKWENALLTARRYKTYEGRNKSTRRILACSIYGELYKVRNDFLHGNRVKPSRLRFKRTAYPLGHYAACLYRMALTSVLAVELKGKVPSIRNTAKASDYIVARMNFSRPQHLIEDAILTATAR